MSEKKLPMVEAEPAGNGSQVGDGATPPPRQVEASSIRLIGTLTLAGALAGIAIVMAFQWANPKIKAHDAEVLKQSVGIVLGGPDHYETVFLDGGRFTMKPATDTAELDRVYVGYDASGKPTGVAIQAEEAGFQDIIDLLFGYDPANGEVIGMTVLNSNETPGLGAKITSDSSFIKGFDDVATPLLGVKKGQGKGKDNEVVMITGATISSRAVIKIINDRLAEIGKPVDSYWTTIASKTAGSGAATNATSGGSGQ